MKTVNVEVKLFSFNELSENAKQRAIAEQRDFLLEVEQPKDFECTEDYEQQIEFYLKNDTPVVENIELNNYLFFESGELAHCVTYIGEHPKAGITEFYFNNKTYQI